MLTCCHASALACFMRAPVRGTAYVGFYALALACSCARRCVVLPMYAQTVRDCLRARLAAIRDGEDLARLGKRASD